MQASVISNNVSSTFENKVERQQKQRFIFVLQTHSGRIVIGSATNPSRRIAAINSGHNSALPKALQINRIVGIRPVTESETLPSTVKHFCDKYGEERVLCV